MPARGRLAGCAAGGANIGRAKAKEMSGWAIFAASAAALLLCAAIFFAIAVVGCGGGYYNNDGSYRRATWKSSVAWTMAHPAFAAYGRLLLPWREGAASVTVPPMSYFWMCLTTGWNAGAVVGGVNFMIGMEEAGGARFFSFYGAEEVAADAEKADTGLIYIPGEAGKPFALVLPGGGMTSEAVAAEGFTAARALHAQGYPVFILLYRVSARRSWEEQEALADADLGAALRFVFQNAESLGVRADGYAVWGFSAGGRLCYLWGLGNEYGYAAHGVPKPALAVLAYAGWHDERFAGDYAAAPPTFFSFSKKDAVIGQEKVAGIEAYIAALGARGIPTRVRRFRNVRHGYGTGEGTAAAGWMQDAFAFWEALVAE